MDPAPLGAAQLPPGNWPQQGLAAGCEVAGREVLMIHSTRRRGRREGVVEERGEAGGRKKGLLPGLLPGDRQAARISPALFTVAFKQGEKAWAIKRDMCCWVCKASLCS